MAKRSESGNVAPEDGAPVGILATSSALSDGLAICDCKMKEFGFRIDVNVDILERQHPKNSGILS